MSKIVPALSLIILIQTGLTACSTLQPGEPTAATPSELETSPRYASAFGSVLLIRPEDKMIEITHAPVRDAEWPIMQMEFSVSGDVDISQYLPGEPVEFVFDFSNEAAPTIVAIRRTSAKDLIDALTLSND